MTLSPVYEKWREETLAQGRQEGELLGQQAGRQEGRQEEVEALLRVKFGELDAVLLAIAPPLLQLSTADRARLILQSSREELLHYFDHHG
jgi:flagellar biosynthesis/type III secretory pathway protein FliH